MGTHNFRDITQFITNRVNPLENMKVTFITVIPAN